jgi:hypothetical protein
VERFDIIAGRMRLITRVVAGVALGLTLWSAFAFAWHRHASADESASCQVCVAAHSSSPASPSPTLRPLFRRVVRFRARAISSQQEIVAFALYVRPPPAF